MKKITVIALCTGFCMQLSLAQQPSQPNYEKKVYVDENEKTYVQKSLPLYLKFSTTENGQNHALNSKATSEYTNPMYLDTEGVNYIRSRWAVDPKTGKTVVPQKELLYELYADGIAPSTSISFTGAPRYRAGGKVYYGKGLNVSLSSRDGVSGVDGIHYALNAKSYSDYGNTLSVSDEREHMLYYYAHDKVGNAENPKSRTFTVDVSSPKTTSTIVGIRHNENIIAPSTRFSLASSDNLAGVRTTYYSFDSRDRRAYGSAIGVSYLSDGEHTLHFHSIDNVKNEETRNSFQFYLDKIAPVVTYSIKGDQHKGSYTYVSPRTKINLSATDNKAGVKMISYNIDGTGSNTFGSDFNIPDRSGLHYVRYNGTDNVENASSRKTLTVFMDNTAPTTGIKYGRPQFFDRDTLFINSSTDVSLFKRDAHSGVQKTEYSMDGGAFQSYAKFNIQKEGNHNVTFRSTDNVNNVEQDKNSRVFVDNSPPEIYVNFSIDPIGKKDGLNVYPSYTRMYVGATDKHCGTAEILYSTNGDQLRAYSSPYTLDVSEVNRFSKEKKYTVKVVAKDKLGNRSEKDVEFYVGE